MRRLFVGLFFILGPVLALGDNPFYNGGGAASGGGSPGGSNTQIQFNNGGNFGGSSALTWDGSTVTFTGSGNQVFTSSITMSPSLTGQTKGAYFYGQYSGTDGATLPAGLWSTFNYGQSGPVTSAHGGAIFGQAFDTVNTQGFLFGVEGNSLSVSTYSTVFNVGVVGHANWIGVNTTTPTAQQVGVGSRAEITGPDRTTARVGNIAADIMAFRAETYGGYADRRRNYNFYGLLSNGKIVNNGQIFGIPQSVQTVIENDTILDDSLGTVKRISSASAVTLNATNPFSAPSSATDGTGNAGGWECVCNTGANPITIPASANFLADGGISQVLNSGACITVISDGTWWHQIGKLTTYTVADTYLSSATVSANTAATTVWGNHGTITLTPGEWDVYGACNISLNGATMTAVDAVLSAYSGNTTTDHVVGDNQLGGPVPTAATATNISIPDWRAAIASSTAYYIKVKATFSAGNPQAACRTTARRIH